MSHRPLPPTPGRRSRSALGLAALLVVVLAAAGCVPLVSPATSGRQYGQGPVDAIWDAADAQPKCAGLTSAELAAMMLVPTYPEAGGTVPSPMTLSRWDNLSVSSSNANLFAFGQTTGPYVNAFFSPGIGLWQFDSAGGWPMTAADAIDTVTAAKQAASTIAYRYCNPTSSIARDDVSLRRYAWGPWFGCSSSSNTNCEQLYAQLYTNEQINLTPDQSVGRFGGMEQRTCDLAGVGTGLTCWYVDPARAQGSTGWRAGTYDPTRPNYVTPLPKPFYVVSANGREYRIWIQADTGYDIGITASKGITQNARTSLTWQGSAGLCDRTAGRGTCGATARVASTPWGPRSGDPFGSFDSATVSAAGSARLTGWAIDPDTSSPISVHVYVDGTWAGAVTASAPRPDVGGLIPGYGDAHGVDTTISIAPGRHSVCLYAINVGPYGSTNPSLGCRDVDVSGVPFGSLDGAAPVAGGISVSGWAIDPDTSSPIAVHLYVDDAWAVALTAGGARPDIGDAFPRSGPNHGFSGVVQTTGGAHKVCAYAIDTGPNGGGTNPLIGCATVTVSSDPFGNYESAVAGPGSVRVSGWALDPDTGDATVQVSVDGTVVATLPTGDSRPDVGAAFGRGNLHGYSGTVSAAAGSRSVCVTVVNQGPGTSRSLGCRPVTVPTGNPFGNFEGAVAVPGGVRLVGWVLDPDTAAPVTVHVYAAGAWVGAYTADAPRPDVGLAYPGWGASHGIDVTVPVPPGVQVCVYAINVGGGTTNPSMGCRAG